MWIHSFDSIILHPLHSATQPPKSECDHEQQTTKEIDVGAGFHVEAKVNWARGDDLTDWHTGSGPMLRKWLMPRWVSFMGR